jgi:hypothetical protein
MYIAACRSFHVNSVSAMRQEREKLRIEEEGK